MEEGKESVGKAEEIKRKILAFCKAHDFYVHPAKDLDNHVKRVIEIGCPCDSRRRECPCEQAVEEIEQGRGACACTILVSKEYLEEWHYAGNKMPLYLRKKRRPVTLFTEKDEK